MKFLGVLKMYKQSNYLTLLVGLILFIILWPIIKWLVLIVVAVVVSVMLYFRYKYYKARQKIEEQYQKAVEQPFHDCEQPLNDDAIDVSFKEKEIDE